MTDQHDNTSRCPTCGHRLGRAYSIVRLEYFTVYRFKCEECRLIRTVTRSALRGRSIVTIPVRDNLL